MKRFIILIGLVIGTSLFAKEYSCINVSKSGEPTTIKTLVDVVSGDKVPFKTDIKLSYKKKDKKEYLVINFDCLDDKYVADNNMTENNTSLYQQEVFEVFITSDSKSKAPKYYYEFEISPMNAFLAIMIYNENGTGITKDWLLDPTEKSGFKHTTKVDKDNHSWSGEICIPLNLIRNKNENEFKINFFRMVSLAKHDPSKAWKFTLKDRAFLALSPTGAKAFHHPAAFVKVKLIDN